MPNLACSIKWSTDPSAYLDAEIGQQAGPAPIRGLEESMLDCGDSGGGDEALPAAASQVVGATIDEESLSAVHVLSRGP